MCAEGNAWDDGRCQSEYDWQAGFYYGQVEAGIIEIDEVPGPFYETPTPTPTPEPEPDKPNKCAIEIEGWEIYQLPFSATSYPIGYSETDPGLPECAPVQ